MWRSEGKGESKVDSGGGLCEIVHKTSQPQTHILFSAVFFRFLFSFSDSTDAKANFYITLIMQFIHASYFQHIV